MSSKLIKRFNATHKKNPKAFSEDNEKESKMYIESLLSQKDTTKLACAVLISKSSPQPCSDSQSTARKHTQSLVELGEIQKQTQTYDVIFDT